LPRAADNRLLATLSVQNRPRLAARCDAVELKFGQVLADPDKRIQHVYFPLTAVLSLIVPAAADASLEVGLVGYEGMLGATIALGVRDAPLHAVVQCAGFALRLPAGGFARELIAHPVLRAAVLRYCYAVVRQTAQTAACTHYHPIEARLARWLLMMQDRTRDASFYLTHEFLGLMLGVRRVGVTQAAGALQRRRLIGYRRGAITVLDRRGLEAVSCRCYSALQRVSKRYLA
jgi:hypothetical protein